MRRDNDRTPPSEKRSDDYVVRVVDDLSTIDVADWNALVEAQPSSNPFMRIEYLLALQESGSASAETGWQAQFLMAYLGEELVATCPLYVKDHSYGEYVFDWAWADAYDRHGLAYYPKLVDSVPFTPVPGPRLMSRTPEGRLALLEGIETLARRAKLSSAHLLFLDEVDQAAARTAGWLMRSTVQFHWQNRADTPYLDFADFLSTLHRDKRKKIQQERRRVNEAQIEFTELRGRDISTADWDFFYRCYALTYRAHHSTPYLKPDFFKGTARSLPDCWLMFVAWRDGQRVAASLVMIDPLRKTAFGRYWGAVEHINCLHFEACYYRPLAWCISNGFARFEGGAQGEHKMARGLLPVQTWSAHWLAHPQFAEAIGNFLEREGTGIENYLDELNERRPFKSPPEEPAAKPA
jgi:predicted N-acyltransferase